MYKKAFIVALIAVGSLQAADYTEKIGLAFSPFQGFPNIALRYHIVQQYCISPVAGLAIANDNTLFAIGVGNLIYLPSLAFLDQYVDIKLLFEHNSRSDLRSNIFNFFANYGLQYPINQGLSIFGEAGLGVALGSGEDAFTIPDTELGIIFYLR